MDDLLIVQDIVKNYSGRNVLNKLSFRLKKGEILGVLGPNGAGKTTLFRILMGLLQADEGQICLQNDLHPGSLEYKRSLGVVPQDVSLYGNMTVEENLRFFGRLYGAGGRMLASRIDEILEEGNLQEKRKEPIRNLSGGMKRRANIAAALLHHPQLIIMDEPTVGIDSQNRSEIWDMIRKLKEKGKSVLLTSHYMEEMKALTDRVILINAGRVMAQGTADDPTMLYRIDKESES